MVKAKAAGTRPTKNHGGRGKKTYSARRHNYAEADNATCFSVFGGFRGLLAQFHSHFHFQTLFGQLLFEAVRLTFDDAYLFVLFSIYFFIGP